MSIKKGDFILLDYTGKIKETEEVFDTTIEEVARNEKLYKAGGIYEPKLVVVGEKWVLNELDENLTNYEVDESATIEIPPEKAFGNRDPEKVKLVSLRRLTSRGITPRVGMSVEVDGKIALIRTMGSGRVQLDYNPPLAGKTLVYGIKIRKKIKSRKAKIRALVHWRIPSVDVKKFELKTRKEEVTVTVPEDAFYIEGLQLAKRGITTDIRRFFPQITTVKFIEFFKWETDVKKP